MLHRQGCGLNERKGKTEQGKLGKHSKRLAFSCLASP
uniref:Uncharacterized protein n=1 Tax=Arundo donax TaxID=35708 RepID=A0A0A9BEB6_ARUDO